MFFSSCGVNNRVQKFEKDEKSALSAINEEIIVIDSVDVNFSFLDSEITLENIVVLGEAGHGDGTTFDYKLKAIKYLHEKKGFNYLVMEGGSLYALNKIVNFPLDTADLTLEYRRSIFPVWAFAQEFIATLNYVGRNRIKLLGIESQQSVMNNQYFPEDLAKILNLEKDEEFLKFADLYLKILMNDFKTFKVDTVNHFFQNYLIHLEKEINSKIKSDQRPILLNTLASIKVTLKNSFYDPTKLNDIAAINNARDSMMFENFLVQYDPSEKYIIWTATFHGVKNIHEIFYNDSSDVYQRQKLFGSYLNEAFPENSYVLAFNSGNGEVGTALSNNRFKIDPCDNCYIENILDPYKSDVFLSFKELAGNYYLDSKLINSTLFGVPHEGKWFKQIDGLIYINKMQPAHFYNKSIGLD